MTDFSNFQPQYGHPSPTPPSGGGFLQSAGEVLFSPVRGAEGAVHDFYGLFDMMAFDALPDWDEERIFGHAETTAGKVATGLMQFAAGFIGTGGGVGLAAKGAAKLGAKGVSKGLTALNTTHGGLKGVGAGAVKGALTDFAFFDGHEARLSDAVKGTFLENDISRLLETEEDDSELEGRLKNTIEGLGLGALADLILVGAKGVGRHRRNKAFEADKQETYLPVGDEDLQDVPKFAKKAERMAATDEELAQVQQQVANLQVTEPGGEVRWTATRGDKEYHFTEREAKAGLSQEAFAQNDDTLNKAGFGGVENVGRFVDNLVEFEKWNPEALRDPVKFQELYRETVGSLGDDNVATARLGNLLNLESDSLPAVIRALETTFIGRLRAKGIADEDTGRAVLEQMSRMFDDAAYTTPGEKAAATARVAASTGLREGAELADEVVRRSAFAHYMLDTATDDFARKLDELGDPRQFEDDDLLDFIESLHNLSEIYEYSGRMRSAFGRGMRNVRWDVRDRVRQMVDEADPVAVERKTLATEEQLLKSGADPLGKRARSLDEARTNIINHIERVRAELKSVADGTQKERLAAILGIAKGSSKNRPLGRLTEYWMGNLLMGPKTHLVNTISNATSLIMMPVETALGGVAQMVMAPTGITRFGAGWESMQYAMDQAGAIMSAALGISKMHRDDNMWKAVGRSLKSGDSRLMGGGEGHELFKMTREKQLTGEWARNSWIGAMTRLGLGDEMGDMVAGGAVDALGKVQRAPFHALAAMDEMSKQLIVRADLTAQFAREARRNPNVTNVSEYVAEQMHKALVDGQALSKRTLAQISHDELIAEGATFGSKMARDEAIMERASQKLADPNTSKILEQVTGAIRRAEDRTFQTPLGRDSMIDRAGRALDYSANQVPIVRLFAPFIRTPVNLLKFAGKRTLADPAMMAFNNATAAVKRVSKGELGKSAHEATRIMATGTDIEKAEVLGRWAMASGMLMFVWKLANNHMENVDAGPDGPKHHLSIVGRGPANPAEKQAWLAAGNQEYSIRMGDTSISFARLDPIATVLGVSADLLQFAHFAEGEEAQDVGMAMAFAISNNFTSKSYLQGLENLMTVMQGEDPQKVGRIIDRMAASFAPGGQAMAQVNTAMFDGELKEIRSIVDAAYARYPGLSEKVEPRRDVLGRELEYVGWDQKGGFAARWSPFPVTDAENADPVNVALANTRHNWSKPRRTTRYGGIKVDLYDFESESGQSAYDRLQELTGTLELGGRTLNERLNEIISADSYKALDARAIETPYDDPTLDPRVKLLGGVITAYRTRAKALLYKEFKPIRDFVTSTRQQAESPRPKGLFK